MQVIPLDTRWQCDASIHFQTFKEAAIAIKNGIKQIRLYVIASRPFG